MFKQSIRRARSNLEQNGIGDFFQVHTCMWSPPGRAGISSCRPNHSLAHSAHVGCVPPACPRPALFWRESAGSRDTALPACRESEPHPSQMEDEMSSGHAEATRGMDRRKTRALEGRAPGRAPPGRSLGEREARVIQVSGPRARGRRCAPGRGRGVLGALEELDPIPRHGVEAGV